MKPNVERLARQYTLSRMKVKPYATPSDLTDAFIMGWLECQSNSLFGRIRWKLRSLMVRWIFRSFFKAVKKQRPVNKNNI